MYDTYDCAMTPILYALHLRVSNNVNYVDFFASFNDLFFVSYEVNRHRS